MIAQEQNAIAGLMKRVMRAHGLKQSGLAQVLGASLSRVKAITSGRVNVLKREEQDALVSKLGVRAEWLISGRGAMQASAMHPELIKAHLRMKGITLTALANELGVAHCSVSLVIRGKDVSKRIRAGIAEAIGMPVDVLWPAPPLQPPEHKQ